MTGEWARRIWYLLNRRRRERELEEEMRAHREEAGDPRSFGSLLRLREESRDAWGWTWLDNAARDARLALRGLARTPVFALASFLILTTGIGINLALFTFIDAAALRPRAVKDPFSLVRFYWRDGYATSSSVPNAAAQFLAKDNTVLSAVLLEKTGDVAWDGDGTYGVRISFVSANWFDELGYGAVRGRTFIPGVDDRRDAPPVVVVSHDLWTSRLGADPGIAGKTIRLNNRPVMVCGVASAGFPGLRLSPSHVWAPISQIAYLQPGFDERRMWAVDLYARMKPGVTPRVVREALRAPLRDVLREQDRDAQDPWLEPLPGERNFLSERERREVRTMTAVVMLLSAMVLLVVCANLASLVLCRVLVRLPELSVRMALGASRARVLLTLTAEAALLCVAGVAGGLALGYYGARALAAAAGLPAYLDFTPDWRIATLAVFTALVTTLVIGVLPAWRISRCDLNAAMKDGGQRTTGALERTRLRSVLIGAQAAGSLVLLVIAAMTARGVQQMLLRDPGFSFDKVAVVDPALDRLGYQEAAARAFWTGLRERMLAHPSTEAVALTSVAPLGRIVNEGRFADAPGLSVTHLSVEPSFFQVMRIPILAGRALEPAGASRSEVVVSRRLALTMYGTSDVVGRLFPKSGSSERSIIVGVAADADVIKFGWRNLAQLYRPIGPEAQHLVMLARARDDGDWLPQALRDSARSIDERVLASANLLKHDFERTLEIPRKVSAAASALALLTLAVAALGVFGITSWNAASKRKEIGIRMALGAGSRPVAVIVMRQVLGPLLVGVLAGLAASVPVSRLFASKIPGFSPEPAASAAATLFLLVAAAAATIGPVMRALRSDPLDALRHE